MQVRFPRELSKQCQASYLVDIGIHGFSRVPQRCHTSPRVVSRSLGWQSSQCTGIRCFWSGLGLWGLFKLWYDFWSSLEFHVETAFSWVVTGTPGFLSWWSREMDPYWGPAPVDSRVSEMWTVRQQRCIDRKRVKEIICSLENRGENIGWYSLVYTESQ